MAAKLAENAIPCPFCDSPDIHYSTKSVNSRDTTQIKAACFCNNCHAYGPRVLSSPIKRTDYKGRDDIMKNPEIKALAIEKWNTRNK